MRHVSVMAGVQPSIERRYRHLRELLFGGDARQRHDPAVRQAALLYTAAGLIGVVTDFMPTGGLSASVGVDCFNIVIGLVLLTSLGCRLSGRWSLGLALLGFANVAMSNSEGAVPAPTLGIWFVLIFIWVGSWHRRGSSLMLAPFATAAYLLPLAFGAPVPKGAVGAAALVIPVGVLVGEVIAANAQSARRAAHALARATVTDELTGLGNRRLGDQLLDTINARDAVAILDIDHFKQVNDNYGHARGDAVLHELGGFLRSSLRASDEVARMGGEEFLVVLRQPAAGDETYVIQRLLADWRAQSPTITISAGVAVHSEDQSPAETYRRADAALYAAKQAGRDRVISASTIDVETEVAPVEVGV